MNTLTMQSPAKVNLYLKVLGRRQDGYHELLTLFHRISLCDRLTFRRVKRPGFRLIVHHSTLKRHKQNLIYAAYRLLSQIVSWAGGVEVELVKRVPISAGLGGGSSNAAHFLLGMNRLLDLGLPPNTLARLGSRLGADVPFFLGAVNQGLGAGRGTCVISLPTRKWLWFVLVTPPFRLSTRLVYKKLNAPPLTRISRFATITSDFFGNQKVGAIPSGSTNPEGQRNELPLLFHCRNDLFRTSCALRPALRQIALLFEELGAEHTMMTGSGPTMMSIHRSEQKARRLARRLRSRRPELKIFVCHTY